MLAAPSGDEGSGKVDDPGSDSRDKAWGLSEFSRQGGHRSKHRLTSVVRLKISRLV